VHILLLETTRYRGFDVVTELARHGVAVSFVTTDLDFYRDKPGFGGHTAARRIVPVPGLDAGDLVPAVRAALAEDPPDGVLCLTDAPLIAAAELAGALGLPHESVETLRLVADKAQVRERLRRDGLGTTRWQVARSAGELASAAAAVGYPVVLKPLSGSGSVGVRTVWTPEAVDAESVTYPVLVEQRLSGAEVSAEMFVQDGMATVLGFARRVPTRPDVVAELGGHFPAEFDGLGPAKSFVDDVVRAVGLRHGFLHVELVLTPTGPELVELNARPAGHVVVRQMSLALNRSIEMDLARLAAGLPVDRDTEPVAALSLRHLHSARGGVVRGIGRVRVTAPGVVDLEIGAGVGDRVRPLRSNRDRFGHVLTRAPRPAEAEALAERVMAELAVEIDDTGETGDVPGSAEAGPHLLLLLGTDSGRVEPTSDRVWTSVGAVTGHVSVLWLGDHDLGEQARAGWLSRFAGVWRRVASVAEAVAEAAGIHETDEVLGVCAMGGETAAGEVGRAVGRTVAVRAATASRVLVDPEPDLGGQVVLSFVQEGRVEHLAVFDELPDASTLAFPCSLPTGSIELLRREATRAVESLSDGPVWTLFEHTAGGTRVHARTGLRADLVALYDAVSDQDIVAATARAAFGIPVRSRCAGAAVLRRLPTPPGRFRVVDVTEAAVLRALPDVTWADVRIARGGTTSHAETPVWLSYVVTGDDVAACAERADAIERGVELRSEPLDTAHVLVLDRIGGATCTDGSGAPILPPGAYRTTVISGAPMSAWQGVARPDGLMLMDVFDAEAVRTVAEAVHRNHPVHRIAAASERLLGPAAALRERFGVTGMGVGEARRYTDKTVMKRLARAAGIRCADGTAVHGAEDVRRLFDKHGRVVLKPSSGSGSNAVTVCSAESEVEAWLAEVFVPGRFLAEEFVEGGMCHLDAVVTGGEVLAWDLSRYVRDTLAYQRGLPLSSRTVGDPGLREAGLRLLAAVVEAWGVRDEVLHLEAFHTGEGLVFCELAGRPGGAGVIEAFRITRGIDLRHAKIALDSGADVRARRTAPIAEHAGWTVHYSAGGRLAEYDDTTVAPLARVRVLSGEIGRILPPSGFSGTGVGKYVFAGGSEDEVLALIARAEREVTIRFDEVDR
jgi:biotin carboxylase